MSYELEMAMYDNMRRNDPAIFDNRFPKYLKLLSEEKVTPEGRKIRLEEANANYARDFIFWLGDRLFDIELKEQTFMVEVSLPLEQILAQKNLLKIVIQKLKDDYRPSCGTPPRIPTPRVVKAEDSGRPGVHGQAYGGSSSRVSSSTRAGSEASQGTQSSSAYTSRSSSSSRRSSSGSQGTQSSNGSSRTSSSTRFSSGGSQGYQSSSGSSRTSSCGSQGYQSSSGSTPRSSSSSHRSSEGSQGTHAMFGSIATVVGLPGNFNSATHRLPSSSQRSSECSQANKSSNGSTPRSSSSSRRSSGASQGTQRSSGSTPRSSSSSRGGTQASQRSATSTLGDDACIVCYENRANACLAPCGHHNVCMGCADRLNPKLCPSCRAPFSMVIKKVG